MRRFFYWVAGLALLYATSLAPALAADVVSEAAPSSVFDLRQWKLQLPGPKEVKNLQGYSSAYFGLDAERHLRFRLDAAEKGTTPNTSYVRAELRHLPNWSMAGPHVLSAEFRAVSRLKPDRLTVLQIHGITDRGENAPPLLRIALNNGDLVAVIKTTVAGDSNDTVMLQRGLEDSPAKVEVRVQSSQMTIAVNGEVKASRNLSFWTFPNYWKAGIYPQAHAGIAEVVFYRLDAD